MVLTATAEPYIPGSIPFAQYVEQLEWIFEHNNCPSGKYKASFLAVCGQEVYTETKKLFPGKDLKTLTYKEITDALKKRYDKTDSDVIHSFRFWTCRQRTDEKAMDFILRVKVLAEACNFGDFKERAIRDVLVIGVRDTNLQKRLCDEEDLTAEKAEKIILNQELAIDHSRMLKVEEEKVNLVSRSGQRSKRSDNKRSSKPRFRGRSRDRSYDSDRSFSNDENRDRSDSSRDTSNNRGQRRRGYNQNKPVYFCSFCKNTGHTRDFCYELDERSPIKGRSSVNRIVSPKQSSSGLFERLKQDLNSSSDDDHYPCMMISAINKVNSPCYVEATIDERRLTMEIDSGSAETVISEDLFKRNFRNHTLERCNKKLVVVDGKKLIVSGKVFVTVTLEGVSQELYMIVLRCEREFIPLMGRTWLDVFYTGWRGVFSKPRIAEERIDAMNNETMIEDETKEENIFPLECLPVYKPKTPLDFIIDDECLTSSLGFCSRSRVKNSSNDGSHSTLPHKPDKLSDQFSNLKPGEILYYKNNKTHIERWLPVKFLKQISFIILQVSLGGRTICAHIRQLKLPLEVQRNAPKKLAFYEEQSFCQNGTQVSSDFDDRSSPDCFEVLPPRSQERPRQTDFVVRTPARERVSKRRREAASSESDDFYGFASESSIYQEEVPEVEIRTSSNDRPRRKIKKRQKLDFHYY